MNFMYENESTGDSTYRVDHGNRQTVTKVTSDNNADGEFHIDVSPSALMTPRASVDCNRDVNFCSSSSSTSCNSDAEYADVDQNLVNKAMERIIAPSNYQSHPLVPSLFTSKVVSPIKSVSPKDAKDFTNCRIISSPIVQATIPDPPPAKSITHYIPKPPTIAKHLRPIPMVSTNINTFYIF